jgi:hypothetical protein
LVEAIKKSTRFILTSIPYRSFGSDAGGLPQPVSNHSAIPAPIGKGKNLASLKPGIVNSVKPKVLQEICGQSCCVSVIIQRHVIFTGSGRGGFRNVFWELFHHILSDKISPLPPAWRRREKHVLVFGIKAGV